jgi:hypothetical protein
MPSTTAVEAPQSAVVNGRYTVWKKSLTDFSDKSDTAVSSFADSEAAQNEANRLNEAEKGFQFVYTVVENPTTGSVASKVKALLDHKNPGDTLKEYKKRIQDAYARAKEMKATLLSMTGTISRGRFDEANRLIDDYNRTRADARNYEGGQAAIREAYAGMARVRPEDLTGRLDARQSQGNEKAPNGGADQGDKKYLLSVQKREDGRWHDVGEKRTFTDYSEFVAAYKAEKEGVDEANKGLPGMLWAVNWEVVSKPKAVEFHDAGFVDLNSNSTHNRPSPRRFVGTTWAGSLERKDDTFTDGWRDYGDVSLVTLERNGVCHVLFGRRTHTVERFTTTWQEQHDGFVITEYAGLKHVYVHITTDNGKGYVKAYSDADTESAMTVRLCLYRGRGLQWVPQLIDSGDYFISSSNPDECEYTTAKP